MSALSDEILEQKLDSYDSLSRKRILWDTAEKLFHGQLNDSISIKGSSQVFDPKLSTLIIERGYRVMAQLGVGKVKGISNNDLGDAKLKNLLLEKYVVPNANAQFDFLTKMRMVDIYSNVYGCFYVLIDQDVKKNGYVGPDMWLLNIRDVFPQVGAISLEDSDSIIIRTWRPLSFFENLKPKDGYKNLSQIVEILKNKPGSKHNRDSENNSKRNENQYSKDSPSKGQGYYEVLTRFERDRWTDIVVDANKLEFRDQKNPHDNGELPVECKYSIPLIDDVMGMGDMERGGSMQMAINSNWNLYFDGVRMSTEPPIIINKDNVSAASTFKSIPGARWLGRGNVNNIAMPLNLAPKGIETFNNTYNVANAAIQNLFGTSNTDIGQSVDQTLGKTPQALKMQSQRENTRDNADRFYMEQFINRVMKKMCNLISKKQSNAVSFRMFPDEIEQIARDYPEVKDMYDENTGKITIKKGKGSTLYDYEIISGSTFAVDKKSQQDMMQSLLTLWQASNTPQGNVLEQQLKAQGYNFKFGELFKRIMASSGLDDWDKILEEMTVQEQGDATLQDHASQFQQVLSQLQGGGINAVPPTPQDMSQGMPQQMQQQPMQQFGQ